MESGGKADKDRGITVSRRYVIEWICRLFIGGVFIYAGITKILDPCQFAEDIYNYHLIPGSWINLSAIIMPYFEVILGGALILGICSRGASAGIILILVFFVVLLGINFIRGISFDCGCFGSGEADLCRWLIGKYEAAHHGLGVSFKARLQSGCDIVRDIFLMIPAWIVFSGVHRKSRRV